MPLLFRPLLYLCQWFKDMIYGRSPSFRIIHQSTGLRRHSPVVNHSESLSLISINRFSVALVPASLTSSISLSLSLSISPTLFLLVFLPLLVHNLQSCRATCSISPPSLPHSFSINEPLSDVLWRKKPCHSLLSSRTPLPLHYWLRPLSGPESQKGRGVDVIIIYTDK